MAFKPNSPGCCSCGGPASPPVALPGCLCATIPPVLDMTSLHPACNGGLFQSCTLAYGDVPAGYAAPTLPAKCFLSLEVFTTGTASFRYYFTCNGGAFSLSRVFAASGSFGPSLDSVRYSWALGAAGNSCTPFALTSGQIFPGGDPTCAVTITEHAS